MGTIDSILDKIFGKVGGSQVSTVDKQTAREGSEQTAIKNSVDQQLLISTIAQKRKFKPTITSVPGKEGISGIRKVQQFAVSANLSGGIKGGLTTQQVNDIRAKPFTEQELEDIKKLNARRGKSFGTAKFSLKDSGEEVVFQKRQQEAISKSNLTSRFGSGAFFKGKLFANPKFGAPSSDPRNLSAAEREEVRQNKIRNARVRIERNVRGQRIQANLDVTGVTQSQAALARGGILRGGNTLNARALAKLQEKGLI